MWAQWLYGLFISIMMVKMAGMYRMNNKVLLSKPNPDSNSMQLRLRLDTKLTANPRLPRTFRQLLDKLGS